MDDNYKSILQTVKEEGWIELNFDADKSLFEFAENFGNPIGSRFTSLAGDILCPTRQQDTVKLSMSKKYGLNAFPYHTDCAYYTIPPRLIFFRIKNINNSSATMLMRVKDLSLNNQTLEYLKSGLFLIKGYKKLFYSHLLIDNIFRWDEDCIEPIDKYAKVGTEIIQKSIINTQSHKHYWQNINKILIVDNWQILHAREKCNNTERALERILVEVN